MESSKNLKIQEAILKFDAKIDILSNVSTYILLQASLVILEESTLKVMRFIEWREKGSNSIKFGKKKKRSCSHLFSPSLFAETIETKNIFWCQKSFYVIYNLVESLLRLIFCFQTISFSSSSVHKLLFKLYTKEFSEKYVLLFKWYWYVSGSNFSYLGKVESLCWISWIV